MRAAFVTIGLMFSVAWAPVALAGPVVPNAGTLYYTQGDSSNGLFILNTLTGEATHVGLSGSPITENNGLAPTASLDLLYGSRANGLLETRADGSGVTRLGTLSIEGLAFDAAGETLYGSNGAAFFTIDTSTGDRLLDLPSPGIELGGLAFGNGTVFALADGGNLLAYNATNANWLVIGATGIDFVDAGLAYDPSGNVLFAKNGNLLDGGDPFLYAISPIDAATSAIGDTGMTLGGGLAFVVPEPATLILLTLAFLVVVCETRARSRTH